MNQAWIPFSHKSEAYRVYEKTSKDGAWKELWRCVGGKDDGDNPLELVASLTRSGSLVWMGNAKKLSVFERIAIVDLMVEVVEENKKNKLEDLLEVAAIKTKQWQPKRKKKLPR